MPDRPIVVAVSRHFMATQTISVPSSFKQAWDWLCQIAHNGGVMSADLVQ